MKITRCSLRKVAGRADSPTRDRLQNVAAFDRNQNVALCRVQMRYVAHIPANYYLTYQKYSQICYHKKIVKNGICLQDIIRSNEVI